MKVLINSNGSPAGTFVFDASGRAIEGRITNIVWSIQANGLAKAVVTFEDVEIAAAAEMPNPLGR